ncbi:hypothetical protein BAUCODRAFT_24866 [Baudoinia panamericana UAMH 10762]|uniref:F-box domain-containing protein n=1 Tax=Baudoinia panamericana (strain UAMH 10762) TaxID=717646 RepID=M2NAJ9_BAUPA|nr:uncharacterized protein BAUCODRAFT_24866 [Baudoinia panamericana UAMH 10762]EMC95875.1 hypothetical protein BAUCODRAFT_24866 [Baudoinia panamericana UAMH 10762]
MQRFLTIFGAAWLIDQRHSTPEIRDDTTQPCYLLHLPAELRNAIWREVLTVRSPSDLAAISYKEVLDAPGAEVGSPDLGYVRPHALVQTCRQIRAEALPVFFAENSFIMTNSPVRAGQHRHELRQNWHPHTVAWLDSVPRHVSHIRQLTFRNPWSKLPDIARLLASNGRLTFVGLYPGLGEDCEDDSALICDNRRRRQDVLSILDAVYERIDKGDDGVEPLFTLKEIVLVANLVLTSHYLYKPQVAREHSLEEILSILELPAHQFVPRRASTKFWDGPMGEPNTSFVVWNSSH